MKWPRCERQPSVGEGVSLAVTARMAGVWYLLMAFGTAFGMGFVNPLLRSSGDCAAIAGTILSSRTLVLSGCASTSLGLVAMLFLANALFRLFAGIDLNRARLLVLFVVAGVTISLLNMANLLVAVWLVHEGELLPSFDTNLRQGLMMTFLRAYEFGGGLATLFWGLWLFPFGLLLFQSGIAPRVLGVLMAVGCFPYLAHSAATLFFPGLGSVTAPILILPTIGEVWAILWLLIKGPDAFRHSAA